MKPQLHHRPCRPHVDSRLDQRAGHAVEAVVVLDVVVDVHADIELPLRELVPPRGQRPHCPGHVGTRARVTPEYALRLLLIKTSTCPTRRMMSPCAGSRMRSLTPIESCAFVRPNNGAPEASTCGAGGSSNPTLTSIPCDGSTTVVFL